MIEIGCDTKDKPIRLDVDRLVATRMLLQANSGGGKSWALRRLLEQTYGKVQQLVIDPEGEFYTLRDKLDYVLCGKDGDCPAEPRSADLLARRLLELGCSAVIDIYELKPRDRIRFVRVFLEALVSAPRKLWHPALVVLDEAHTFAPQVGQSESLDAVADLMAKGRKRSYCGVLATQRISKLHKDVAAEANNMLIGRARLDVDRKRAAEDCGFVSRAESLSLQKLRPGEFFAFGPAFDHDDVARMTVGGVKTAHPLAGAGAPPPAPPRAKVKALLGELADLPAEAEAEVRTVESLTEMIRRLERENRRLLAGARPSPEELKQARQEGLEAGRSEFRALADQLYGLLQQARVTQSSWGEASRLAEPTECPAETRDHKTPAPRPTPHSAPLTRAEGIPGPMQRILDAVGWLEASGIPGPYSRVQVAFLAKYSHRGSAFTNPLGKLRSEGLVTYPTKGLVQLTDEGRLAANSPVETLTRDALHQRVRDIVSGPMWRILSRLLDTYPKSMTREELATAAGYSPKGSAFTNPLGKLRTLGLVDYPAPSEVVALDVLFPISADRRGNHEIELRRTVQLPRRKRSTLSV